MVDVIKKELSHLSSAVNAFHIVDESLLIDLMKMGGLAPRVIRRLCDHVVAAEQSSADIIVVTCSSISPAVDVARRLVNSPVLKIDEPMAEVAVAKGRRIGVVATVTTALEATSNLLKAKASESGKEISISAAVCQEAFQAMLRGEMERHDRMVLEKVLTLAGDVDVIILAQGSMARLALPLSQQVSTPVLSSPTLLMRKLKSIIEVS